MTKRLILAVKRILPHIVDNGIDDPESDFEQAVLELVLAYQEAAEQINEAELLPDDPFDRLLALDDFYDTPEGSL